MMAPTDLVVVLPGIMGSTLRQDGHLVWAPSAGVGAARDRHVRPLAHSACSCPTASATTTPATGSNRPALMPDLHVLPGHLDPVKGYDGC